MRCGKKLDELLRRWGGVSMKKYENNHIQKAILPRIVLYRALMQEIPEKAMEIMEQEIVNF